MNLKKKLPVILQSNPFWTDFAEEVQLELQRVKASFTPLKDYFDPDAKTDIESLRDYYREFGMSVSIMLFEDGYPGNTADIIDYLKREANALSFMIRKKGTKDFFDHIFNRIYKKGFSYIFFTDASLKRVSLFRALEIADVEGSILRELAAHDPTLPFTDVFPSIPFKEGLASSDTLDSVKQLTLDDTPAWALDSSLIARGVNNTTHVALEFMLSESVTINSVTQLVDNRYLEYLKNSIAFGRKVSQIPHFGVNLSCWFLKGAGNVISALGMSTSCIAGVGAEEAVLTDLYNRVQVMVGEDVVYEDFLSANELTRTTSFDLLNFSIPANSCYPVEIATVINSNVLTYGGTFGRTVIPHSLRVYFEDINSDKYILKDDGNGYLYFSQFEGEALLDEGYSGTIDYATGAVTVSLQTVNFTFNPKVGTLITAYFKTAENLQVDELRIIDDADVEVLSASFNPIILNSPDYHISFTCIVDRR